MRLGRFRLLGRVARSGEGAVFRAEDEGGRPVAVKVLDLAGLGADAQRTALARLARAARLWRRLDHPAIVRIVAAGRAGESAYVATEWIAGPTLDAVLGSRGPLGAVAALDAAEPIAEGLAHAHARGVLHRDVKPANIFLDGGRARLGDFGLARPEREGLDQDLASAGASGSGEAVGTFAYMAPEQARDGRDASARTDLYGLGATLFHALAGRPPHGARSLGEAVRRVLAGAPPLPPEVRGAGGFLGAVVARALAPRPEDRYASALEMLADLRVARRLERLLARERAGSGGTR